MSIGMDDKILSEHYKIYELIGNKTTENIFIQGAGGIIGTVATAVADVYAFKIYSDLWDEIRCIYGYSPIEPGSVQTLLPKLGKEVIADIIFDKILGYIPLIGIATNAMCAKSMTWRLGILFAILSSRGDKLPDDEEIIKVVGLIREIYPQRDMFSFSTPDSTSVIRLLTGVKDNSIEIFENKVNEAISAFA